jgi:NADH-quinone oxidoreductase subunit E
MPAIAVQEVATFYTMYETTPVGRYKITVCTNLPCALSGANEAAAYLQQKLDIGFNQTTADGLFTLKEGECMGACGDAPVMLLNNTQMCSRMSREKVDQLLADLRAEALAHNAAQHTERDADALTSADAKKDASSTPTSLGAAS